MKAEAFSPRCQHKGTASHMLETVKEIYGFSKNPALGSLLLP